MIQLKDKFKSPSILREGFWMGKYRENYKINLKNYLY